MSIGIGPDTGGNISPGAVCVNCAGQVALEISQSNRSQNYAGSLNTGGSPTVAASARVVGASAAAASGANTCLTGCKCVAPDNTTCGMCVCTSSSA